MARRLGRITSLLALLALTLSLVGVASAQPSVGQAPRAKLPAARPVIDPRLSLVKGLRGGPLAQRAGSVNVMIELSDAPTTRVYADAKAHSSVASATSSAKLQLANIQRAQSAVASALRAPTIGARIIFQVQRVFNGIAAKVDAGKIAQVAQLPGVKSIRPLATMRLSNATSVPLIGAPLLWSNAGLGLPAGNGIKIGVIDTGIDYLHTDFGGPGTAAAYSGNDPTVINDGYFPTIKVAGGYDFAGDNYDADDPSSAPEPDPDPLDCNGHGSHVSGTAAGYGVNANGTTYTGPWNSSTPFSTLRIGPGVAPRATLYALKVFGCAGTTNVTDQAIEYAVDPNGDGDFSDHLDVINMSLGAQYGSDEDSSAVASDNAASIGVIVVTSAGNEGDTYYITGSPGAAGRAIAVASSVDSTDVFDGFKVNSPPAIAGIKPGSDSVNFNWAGKQPVTGALVYPPTQRSGCQAFDAGNKALLAGKIALLDWTKIGGQNECGSATRVTNAANAGAIGVILVYNEVKLDISISGSSRIPSIITLQSVGAELKANLAAGVNVTLSPEYHGTVKVVDNTAVDTLSEFSSRGPRRGNSALKPDIAAPGQSIFSVEALSGNKGTSLNGTSMAAPHVAGSMALLRQIHPTWTVEELKALAMNTASSPVRSAAAPASTVYGPQRVGAGRITLGDAGAASVVAYNATDEGRVSVSFGAIEVIGSTTLSKTIRVVNKGSASATYAVSYAPSSDTPGVSFAVSPSSITVGAGQVGSVTVTMTANAAAMTHTHDPTIAETQTGAPRHWLSEESGRVLLTPGSGTTLRVPVYVAARAASNMLSTRSSLNLGTSPSATTAITLTGTGVGSAAALSSPSAEDEVSLVTAFELQATSPNETSSAGLANNADLRYVGVSSDAAAASPFADATVAFGIATHGRWSSPNEVEFDIYIDTDRDGNDDYVLFNWNLGAATGGDANDVFITYLLNLNDPNANPSLQFLNGLDSLTINTVPYNTSVMMMPAAAADMGLTAASPSFNYTIVSFSRDATGSVDISPTLTYNAVKSGVNVSDGAEGLPAFVDLPGEQIPVAFDQGAYKLLKSQGILLLHHNNAARQAEAIPIVSDFGNKVFMTLIHR